MKTAEKSIWYEINSWHESLPESIKNPSMDVHQRVSPRAISAVITRFLLAQNLESLTASVKRSESVGDIQETHQHTPGFIYEASQSKDADI